ncbi:MAG: cell division protein FtsA [Bryobacteraceae bacterium]|jgi:cell division protein FtsA
MAAKHVLAAGLDAGGAHTRCAILLLENACVRLIGHGEAPSHGWKKSRITDQNEVAGSIRAALEQAESAAQVSIGSAVFGLGGTGIAGSNARGGYELGFPRQIDQNDVNRVVERASRVQLQDDEMLLHLFPQDFAVDARPGYRNPRGMIGSRLEVFVHLVTASAHEHRSLVGAANQAHLVVEETVFEPVAGAYAAIVPDGREEGIALIDIGAQSTDLAVYYGEALIYSSSLPVCGDHLTSDVAHGLLVSTEDAEWIKEQQGCAMLGLTGDNSLIEVPSASGRGPRETRRRELNTILEARAFELFEFVQKELERIGMEEVLVGVVLTGGGARLNGMCDVAEMVLRCQARNGLPVGILDWPEEIETPAWTTAAGLAMYSARLKLRAELDRRKTGIFGSIFR